MVAWHGNYAPYKYDLSKFMVINAVAFDHAVSAEYVDASNSWIAHHVVMSLTQDCVKEQRFCQNEKLRSVC